MKINDGGMAHLRVDYSCKSFAWTSPSLVSTAAASGDKAMLFLFTSHSAGLSLRILHARTLARLAVATGSVR